MGSFVDGQLEGKEDEAGQTELKKLLLHPLRFGARGGQIQGTEGSSGGLGKPEFPGTVRCPWEKLRGEQRQVWFEPGFCRTNSAGDGEVRKVKHRCFGKDE